MTGYRVGRSASTSLGLGGRGEPNWFQKEIRIMLLPVREFFQGEEGYLLPDLALGLVLGDALDHFIRKGLMAFSVLRSLGVFDGLEGGWVLRYVAIGFLRQ